MNFDTKNIQEAEIVEETVIDLKASSTTDDDLLAKLKGVTEVKTPGAPKTETKKETSFWDRSEDFEKEKTSPIAEKKEETKKENSEETQQPTGKITEKLKLGSAKTAVGMLGFTCKLLFPPILNYKLEKRSEKIFTEKQLALLESKLIEAENSELEGEELRTKKRFDSMMKKHTKKMDAVAFTPEEEQDLIDAFKNHFDYTETTLSPGWYLTMAIVNTMGKRAIDAFTK